MRRIGLTLGIALAGIVGFSSCEQEILNKPNDTGRFVKFFRREPVPILDMMRLNYPEEVMPA